jgi:hypothetical protein
MTSRKLLMLNGTLFMKNLIKLFNLAPKLFFQIFLLVISPPNTLPIEIFSALVEFKKMILPELQRPQVQFFKRLLMASQMMS